MINILHFDISTLSSSVTPVPVASLVAFYLPRMPRISPCSSIPPPLPYPTLLFAIYATQVDLSCSVLCFSAVSFFSPHLHCDNNL